jgi:hypothetical protein
MKNETTTEELQNDQYSMPFHELEKLYESSMAKIALTPDYAQDDERSYASVFYGFYKNWNLSKTISYYNLDAALAEKAWVAFSFKKKGGTTVAKTRSKQEVISAYLKQNVGQIVTPAKVSDDVKISLPTFYNFYNANRHFFKKVQRGQFEILDPQSERAKA